MTKNKNNNKKISMGLVIVMMIVSALVLVGFSMNMINIANGKTGTGTTVDVDKNSSIKNDFYIIGNNPTELTISSFEELTNSLKDEDPLEISKNVVKCFISDYFTWTNKDGNYEVGGLQYLYGPQFTMYDVESRWTFYKDLDLYISQYGRENLLEVDSIEIVDAVFGGYFKVEGESKESYYIVAKWTYKNGDLNEEEFQQEGYFTVINNDGRYEIAQFYDSYD